MTKEKAARNALMLKLHKKGYSLRRIADITDVSYERVRQVLKLSPEYRGKKKLTPKTKGI